MAPPWRVTRAASCRRTPRPSGLFSEQSWKGGRLKDSRKILWGILIWAIGISALHMFLNFNWNVLMNDRLPEDKRRLNVGYIPVT